MLDVRSIGLNEIGSLTGETDNAIDDCMLTFDINDSKVRISNIRKQVTRSLPISRRAGSAGEIGKTHRTLMAADSFAG